MDRTISKAEKESMEYRDSLGIEKIYDGDLGCHRGINPILKEEHTQAWKDLLSKMSLKQPKSTTQAEEEDGDDLIEVDLFDASVPHCILHESKLDKKSMHAVVAHTSRRHVFLLNDAFVIAKANSTLLKTTETYVINQAFDLKRISIQDLCHHGDESKASFEVSTSKRGYTFIADTEADKRDWLEHLRLAIYAVHLTSPEPLMPGWQHSLVKGTLYSAALLGDEGQLTYHLGRLGGSSPDKLDDSGNSALHWASFGGCTDAMLKIIEAGGDIDLLNNGLNSALHIASSQGHCKTVQTLLDLGADIRARNLKDMDPLFMAILYCRREKLLESVLRVHFSRGVEVNQYNSLGSTPLHECASRDLAMPIKYLVEEGALVNIKHNTTDLTPLQVACTSPVPNAEVVRALLENGSHGNIKNSNGETPFASVLKAYTSSLDKDTYSRDVMVETFLATLKELARAGARFQAEDISSLRESFRVSLNEARNSWMALPIPGYFNAYVSSKGSLVAQKHEWHADSSSESCPLCVVKFTMSLRRHHCRSCGILCCSLCSGKKLNLGTGSTSPSKEGAAKKDDRVCDPCFNKVLYEAKKFNIHMKTSPTAHVNTNNNNDTVFNATDAKGSNSVTNATQEALDGLHKRGHAMENAHEEGEQMEAGAGEYSRMTKELLRQQQQSSWK